MSRVCLEMDWFWSAFAGGEDPKAYKQEKDKWEKPLISPKCSWNSAHGRKPACDFFCSIKVSGSPIQKESSFANKMEYFYWFTRLWLIFDYWLRASSIWGLLELIFSGKSSGEGFLKNKISDTKGVRFSFSVVFFFWGGGGVSGVGGVNLI